MDPAATGTDGLLAGDLNGSQVRDGRDALSSADRAKEGGEDGAAVAEP